MSKVLVITGPSGVGKSYLGQLLLTSYPARFSEIKIFTTRAPRMGEDKADRIFVTNDEFARKQKVNDFVVSGFFHGNLYGYDDQILQPSSKNLIVNTWPALLPKFESINNAVFLALSVSPSSLDLLKDRMRERGDDETTVMGRLPVINNDIADIVTYKSLIEAHGKLFEVVDDLTIPNKVIPWIKETFSLEA